jgi:hypothetical protein
MCMLLQIEHLHCNQCIESKELKSAVTARNGECFEWKHV